LPDEVWRLRVVQEGRPNRDAIESTGPSAVRAPRPDPAPDAPVVQRQ